MGTHGTSCQTWPHPGWYALSGNTTDKFMQEPELLNLLMTGNLLMIGNLLMTGIDQHIEPIYYLRL